MLWKRSHDTIHVEFVDAATGTVFAQSNVPVQQLPNTVALYSSVLLGDDDWIVERAEPMTSAEFKRSGKLKLTLHKKLVINPHEILYSLPSIEGSLPEVVQVDAGQARILQIEEDAWRHIEFVSMELEPAIHQCFTQIRRIWEEERIPPGFKSLHVRHEVPQPLADTDIRMDYLMRAMEMGEADRGKLGFWGLSERIVVNGFSLNIDKGFALYGIEKSGKVEALCIHLTPAQSKKHVHDRLEQIASQHNLCLVNWCSAQQVLPGNGEFQRYFESMGTD